MKYEYRMVSYTEEMKSAKVKAMDRLDAELHENFFGMINVKDMSFGDVMNTIMSIDVEVEDFQYKKDYFEMNIKAYDEMDFEWQYTIAIRDNKLDWTDFTQTAPAEWEEEIEIEE